MINRYLARLFPLAAAVACGAIGGDANARTTDDVTPVSIIPKQQDYQVVASYPHDPEAWTQGLFWNNGSMYECTGQTGKSTVREVNVTTGEVKRQTQLPVQVFGEGCVLVGDKIYMLTWQDKKGYVFDRATFRQIREWSYDHEGWGLTYDGTHLVLSDGTELLRFLNPQTLAVEKTLTVMENGEPVDSLNELEMYKGELLANIWTEDSIARIDPKSGEVRGWIVLKGLLSESERNRYSVDVLNGIAYDEQGDRLFVTGKLWPKLYHIKLVPHE